MIKLFGAYLLGMIMVLIKKSIVKRVREENERMIYTFVCVFFEDLLHRSDFFPGLGWLLTKTIWNEIKENWPKAFVEIIFRNKIILFDWIDFGMIGWDNPNNAVIEHVFDQKFHVRVYQLKGKKVLVGM